MFLPSVNESSYPRKHISFLDLLRWAIFTDITWYIIVILIWLSPMISNDEFGFFNVPIVQLVVFLGEVFVSKDDNFFLIGHHPGTGIHCPLKCQNMAPVGRLYCFSYLDPMENSGKWNYILFPLVHWIWRETQIAYTWWLYFFHWYVSIKLFKETDFQD